MFDQFLTFKIISGIILFLGAIIFALIPLALSALKNKYIKEQWVLQLLDTINGFGAGALLSSGFLHLLPESHEILTEAIAALQGVGQTEGSGDHGGHTHDMMALGHDHANKIYPYAFLIASLAIVFFYHLEKIVEIIILSLKSFRPKENQTTTVEKEKEVELENVEVVDEKQVEEPEEPKGQESSVVQHKHHHHHNTHHAHHEHDGHTHDHSHVDAEILNSTSTVRAAIGGFILWLSLVSHSVFDGLAIGVLSNTKLWSLFLTILSHHFIAAIALGTVLRNAVKNIFISGFFILSFALTVPVGVIIGIIVSSIEGQVFELIHGISLAFTGGAFIYVAAFEIMGHARINHKAVFFFRTLFFSLGFAAMAIIANYG